MKDKAKGKAQEAKGKATGDRSDQAKGKARQAAGETKRVGRDVRDEVEGRRTPRRRAV